MSERFFISNNKVKGITSDDYERARNYVHAIEAVAKVAHESFYIIDYYAQEFMYVSGNPLFLCGLSPDKVKALGYNFHTIHVPEDELKMLLKINAVGFRVLNNQPLEDRHLYAISYDFHIKHNESNILVHHKQTPLAMDSHGHIWLSVCYVSISNHNKPGNVEIHKIGQSDYWRYDLDMDRWFRMKGIELSPGEKEVLFLSARGLTVDEISILAHRSKNSIKSRKRAIFEKLGVKSISEAIAFATNYKLI